VPHYHDLTSLGRCLDALAGQTYPKGDFEIIVADNASPEGAETVKGVIAGRGSLVIVPEKGAGLARNGGVAAARGEILAFTDADCVPEPNWLREGVEALSRFDIVGGRVRVLVENPGRPTSAEAFEAIFAFDNESYVRSKGFTVTANLFCRKSVFERVGGFKVGVSEDLEWCQRARGAGFRLGYVEAAALGHPARRTWDELTRKWRRLNAETFGLRRPGAAGRLAWIVRTLALPASAVAHTPKVLLAREMAPADRLKALLMLYRLRIWRMVDGIRLAVSG
jgi:glycosyltransferase involved in cell wall biosynthesis